MKIKNILVAILLGSFLSGCDPMPPTATPMPAANVVDFGVNWVIRQQGYPPSDIFTNQPGNCFISYKILNQYYENVGSETNYVCDFEALVGARTSAWGDVVLTNTGSFTAVPKGNHWYYKETVRFHQ